jgi:hypothetical protein
MRAGAFRLVRIDRERLSLGRREDDAARDSGVADRNSPEEIEEAEPAMAKRCSRFNAKRTRRFVEAGRRRAKAREDAGGQ